MVRRARVPPLPRGAPRGRRRLDTSADVVASLVRDDVDVFGDAAAAATVAHGSSADDAFWAARRSAARALSSGHAAAADNGAGLVCDRLARETRARPRDAVLRRARGRGRAHQGPRGLRGRAGGGSADETLKAVGAGLQQHGEALAAGTAQVLANISEATGLELEEASSTPGLARRAAAERDRTLRTKLVEAQVALNGLDAACEAHLGRLRLHLEDEVGASYGSDRGDPAVAKLLEAVAALGRRGTRREGVGDALEKARAALASTALAQPIARSIAGRGGDRCARALRARRRRRGCAAPLGLRRGAVRSLGPRRRLRRRGAARRGRVRAACEVAHLAPRNLVDAARRTAAAAGDALLERERDRARVKKATPLGALQLDRDVRALRAALAAGLGAASRSRRRARGPARSLAQHVATLLGLDDRGEASDVVSRYVAPDELPEVLALRRWPGEPLGRAAAAAPGGRRGAGPNDALRM